MSKQSQTTAAQWNPMAALCAWLVPGLGNWVLGERRRAVIICCGIGGLWGAGLLIGGIGVIDRHSYWFFGQVMIAPTFAVHHTVERLDRLELGRIADHQEPLYRQSFGRVEEQGVLYTALAGLLNLLSIIDVVYRPEGAQGSPLPQVADGRSPEKFT